MADRVWIGGQSGNWTNGANWRQGSAPSLNDDAIFSEPGTYSVTINMGAVCSNLRVSAGNITFTGSSGLSINRSMDIQNVTPTWSGTGTITFNAGSPAPVQTIRTNGTNFNCGFTFNGVGGEWQLQGNLTSTLTLTRTATLTNGTLDLNNFILTIGNFSSSGSTARKIKFGSSGKIVVRDTGTSWNTGTITSLTLEGIPEVDINPATSGVATIVLPGNPANTFNTFSFNFIGNFPTSFPNTGAAIAIRNLNFSQFTGTWTWTTVADPVLCGNLTLSASMGVALTPSSTATSLIFGPTDRATNQVLDCKGKAFDRPILFQGTSSTYTLVSNLVSGTSSSGSTRAVTLSSGTLNLGSSTLFCGTFTSTSGNARGIDFSSGGNITAVAAGGTLWNSSVPGGLSVLGSNPLVNINNLSGTATTIQVGTPSESNTFSFAFNSGAFTPNLTLTAGNYRSLNFTLYRGQLQNTGISVFGDYTLGVNMSFSATVSSATTFASTSGTPRLLNGGGATIPFPITFNGIGGSWQITGSDFRANNTVTWTNGNLDLNNYDLRIRGLTGSPSSSTFTFGNGYLAALPGGTININAISFATANSIITPGSTAGSYIFQGTPAAGSNTVVLKPGTEGTSGATVTYFSGRYDLVDTTNFAGSLSILASTLYDVNITNQLSSLSIQSSDFSTKSANTTVTINKSLGTDLSIVNYFNPTAGYTINLGNNFTTGGLLSSFGNATGGTLNLNGYTLTCGVFDIGESYLKNITMNNGKIVVTEDSSAYSTAIEGSEAVFSINGLIFNDSTGTIEFTNNNASYKSMSANTASIVPKIVTTTPFELKNFYGSSLSVKDIQNVGSGIIYLQPGKTFNFTDFSLSGCTLRGGVGGSTVSKSDGTISVSNLAIANVTATGGATWNSFYSSGNINNGNNNGWNFIIDGTRQVGSFMNFIS
jgi:hypothetical protein